MIFTESDQKISSLFKCNYLKNKKHLVNFLFLFWNLHQILNIFEKKIIVVANVIPKLNTVKTWVGRSLPWKHRFRTYFDSQHISGCQTLVKSTWQHFYHNFWSLWGEMIWEISPLLKLEFLGILFNTFTGNDMCPLRDCQDLKFPIQMQLSQKQKKFSEVFFLFMESSSNFNHFRKKDDRDS